MQEPQITRRWLLKGTGAVLIGGLLLPNRSVSAHNNDMQISADVSPFLIGVVDNVESAKSLLLRVSSNTGDAQFVSVRLTNEAFVSRGYRGAVKDLTYFMPDDEVCVEGQWTNEIFNTTMVTSIYWFIKGYLININNKQAETRLDLSDDVRASSLSDISSSGILQLAPNMQFIQHDGSRTNFPFKFAEKEKIVASLWRDPITGEFVVVRMAPHEDETMLQNHAYLPFVTISK